MTEETFDEHFEKNILKRRKTDFFTGSYADVDKAKKVARGLVLEKFEVKTRLLAILRL